MVYTGMLPHPGNPTTRPLCQRPRWLSQAFAKITIQWQIQGAARVYIVSSEKDNPPTSALLGAKVRLKQTFSRALYSCELKIVLLSLMGGNGGGGGNQMNFLAKKKKPRQNSNFSYCEHNCIRNKGTHLFSYLLQLCSWHSGRLCPMENTGPAEPKVLTVDLLQEMFACPC